MTLPKVKRILYTTSLGPHTRPVYRHALEQARQHQAEVIMLHVINPVGELGEALIKQYLPDELVKKVHDEGVSRVLAQMKTRVQGFFEEELSHLTVPVGVVVTPMVVDGLHDEAILRVAEREKVDLIVMGTEHKFGLHGHSQTTQQVIRRSRVPVLVVPTGREHSHSEPLV
ncbi:universal stress protein [Oceanimonas sp. CHS3-5]|uniref:universal stress protein n=1 Tax=Oceanimonas sp. CHS3-5 TaxID=3068186 RepID=UPI00273DFF12|nr:universal stress protein [Oceanimonas sp. CHS3-5]MDP5291816.1 universal stress protein [Oceanimonas sp. CHS3-5]